MTGKMSLVVLRSWSDCPPKVRAIAPPDDDRSIIIEPDHHGRFNEISQDDPRFHTRERTASAGAVLKRQKSNKDDTKEKVTNGTSSSGGGGGFIGIDTLKDHHNVITNTGSNKTLPLFLRRKTGQLERNIVNRHSYAGVCDNNSLTSPGVVSDLDFGDSLGNDNGGKFPLVGRSISSMHLSSGKVTPMEGLTIRPGSAGSPDHHEGSSLEYTPPSSPVTGRYRNLGPELAATIPKRTIKSSWITGIKSRWMKSTTHPESGRSTLKSYSSSPSLVTAISTVLKEGDEELLDPEEFSEGSPFFNPLYKFTHSNQHQQQQIHNNNHPSLNNPNNFRSTKGTSSASTGSSSGIGIISADEDSQSDRSRSSLSNPVSSYSPSPPPTTNIGGTGILRQQIVYNSSRPNGLQKYNSLTDFSEEDLYSGGSGSHNHNIIRSLSESPYGLNSSGLLSQLGSHSYTSPASDVVLVEVIRKPESPPRNKDIGRLVDKRHSIGEAEPAICNKFAGVRVEGSPGKVARIKESIKKFGRFGRNHSEKILRFQSDEVFNPPRNEDTSLNSKTLLIEDSKQDGPEVTEADTIPPKPAVRRSKTLEVTTVKTSLKEESKTESHEIQSNKPNKQPPVVDNKNSNHLHSSETDQNGKSSDITKTKTPENKANHTASQSTKSIPNDQKTLLTHEPRPKIDIKPEPAAIPNLLENDNENDPPVSIIGDQDRSMSSHILPVPTIDIESCIEDNHHNSGNTLYSVTPVIPALVAQTSDICASELVTNIITKVEKDKSFDEPDGTKGVTLTSDIDKEAQVDTNANSNVNDEDDHCTLSGSAGRPVTPVSPKEDKSSPQDSQMLRRLGGNGTSHNKIINNGKIHANSYASVNGQVNHAVGIYNGNGNSSSNNHFSSASFAPDTEDDEEHESTPRSKGHGRYSKNSNNNGVASVQVPVQAINRHVIGYGVNNNNNNNNSRCSSSSNINNNNNSYANSIEDDRGSGSAASSESRSDSDWQRSSTRASFRGFCEGLLQDEKIILQVPEVVEASINFDNEDSSSLDPDEERENSVEYISIADVKVNHERKLDRTDALGDYGDRDPLPNCVISLDIGSRGSGYSYWIKEESDCVRIGNVDMVSTCPKSHKAPSWVSVDDLYLDLDDDDDNANNPSSPGFGHQALDKYLSDDSKSQILWKWRESFNEGATFPYTLESKPSDDELMLTMKSAIRHYGQLAMDQVDLKRRGGPLGTTVILVAIPSNFDPRARQLVRDAAFGSGLVTQKDAVALIEDPCAAGIYAYHAIKSKIAKSSTHGTCYLSVDIGGAYLHSSGYEMSEGKLHLILSPKSESLVDSPESIFETELSSIFTPSFIFNYQNKYKAGWLKLMTEFEKSKNLYDPMQRGNYYVFVPSSFVDHFRRFTSMELEDALESSDILWSKVGALGIPYWKMQRFIQPLMDFIKDKIINLVKKHNYEYLVLTGGRAGLRYLVEYVKNAVRDFSVEVAVPKEYNAAVLQGSTISLTNLAPRLIIKSPFSIGVGVMTPFIEDQHPEEKRVLRDGKSWCADVWDSLIKVGQDLELNRVILTRSYVGAQPGQSLLILPLFKSPDEPKFVTQSSVQKCCEFKFNSGQRAWQEVELVIKCRPSELLITALDGGVLKNVVVVDYSS